MMETRECLSLSVMLQRERKSSGATEVFGYHRFFKRPL